MTLALADRGGRVRVSVLRPCRHEDARAASAPRRSLRSAPSRSRSWPSRSFHLHDEGRLDLHRPVTEYLPWLKVDFAHGPVTAHHLLSHTSGLPGVPLLPESITAGLDTAYAPGEHFVYSNIGYFILGLLLETLDRRTLADSLARARARPARHERKRARHHERRAPADGRRLRAALRRPAVPRARPPRRGRRGSRWTRPPAASPRRRRDGRLSAHVAEPRARAARARRVLSEESFELLTKPVVKAPFRGEDASYAYGLWVEPDRADARTSGTRAAWSPSARLWTST